MRIKGILLGALLLVFVLTGCGGADTALPDNEATTTGPTLTETSLAEAASMGPAAALAGLPLNDFFEQAYQMILARDPEALLEMGLVSDPDAPQELTDFSLAYLEETNQLYESILEMLHGYDYAALEPFDQVSYQVFEWYLVEAMRNYADANYYYLISPLSVNSYPQLFIMFFTETHPLATPANAEGYVARMHFLDEKIDALTERIQAQADAGFIYPHMVIEYGRMDIKNYLGRSATINPMYKTFLDKTEEIADLDADTRTALVEELTATLQNEVFPAFQRLDDVLADLQAQAPQELGLYAYPDGTAYYNRILRYHTTTELTADEIHALGISELERIEGEMLERFALLGYDVEDDFPSLYTQLERDTGSLTGVEIAQEYERVLSLADEQVNDYFDLRPEGKLEVVGGNVGNYYSPGSLDGSRPGKFFALAAGTQATFKIKTIAYHEGIPGHHFQIMGPKLGDLPFFRSMANFTGYIEGWALYAEYLAWEMDWYADDPAGDLGRLQFEALRAARMVVDTGIHALGWDFDQAVTYIVEHTGLPVGVAQSEVVRYISWPGQATAYLVGKIEIMRMRAEAQEALGEDFDLRQFHNVVLGNGSMPLPTLEDVLEQWVAQENPG